LASILHLLRHGVVSEIYVKHPKDSWCVASFSKNEMMEIAKDNNFTVLSSSGEGTQYFWLKFQKVGD